jgi:cytochrome b involved in lipid metabolism
MTDTEPKHYTREQISTHNQPDNSWTIHNTTVLNISTLDLTTYPTLKSLHKYSGKDATIYLNRTLLPEAKQLFISSHQIGSTTPLPLQTLQKQEPRLITWQEFINHSSSSSCWILIDCDVYDVTDYKKHPGHFDILVGSSRKDATRSFDNVNHSKGAKRLMKKFWIGRMDMETVPAGDLELSGHGVQYQCLWIALMLSIYVGLFFACRGLVD